MGKGGMVRWEETENNLDFELKEVLGPRSRDECLERERNVAELGKNSHSPLVGDLMATWPKKQDFHGSLSMHSLQVLCLALEMPL